MWYSETMALLHLNVIIFYFIPFMKVIVTLQLQCPELCKCTVLDALTNCQGKNLSQLPSGISQMTAELDLSINSFQTIPKNLWDLRMLQVLNLSYNLISSLDANSFKGLNKLEILDLSYNIFTDWRDIHEDTLIETDNLKELHISHNSLGEFPDLVLHPLQSDSLQYLYLVNCSITNIFSDILVRVPNVKELYLQHNQLFVLNTQVKASHLEKLDLSECSLERIASDAFAFMPALRMLVLAKNYNLKAFRSHSHSLQYLDISRCNLASVPLGFWPELRTAYFGGNHFRYIKNASLQSFPALKLLDLSNNSLEEIENGTFQSIPHIEQIDLSFNTISGIAFHTFSDCRKLIKLDLSRNYLTHISALLSESLRHLDISVCEIRDIPRKSLSLMPNLQNLNLSRNLIVSLPDRLEARQLRTLDLSLCRIININNATFKAMPNLMQLDLSGNRLTSAAIKPSFFFNVKEVKLNDNPWFCDCKSRDMRETFDWLVRLKPSTSTSLRCLLPETYSGLTWASVCRYYWEEAELRAPAKRIWAYSLLIVSMTVLLLIIVCVQQRYRRKAILRENELQRHEREETLERLQRRLQRQARNQEEQHISFETTANSREIQRPPSYAEAVCMMPQPTTTTPEATTPSCSTNLNDTQALSQSLSGLMVSAVDRRDSHPGGEADDNDSLSSSKTRRKRRLRSESERKPSNFYLRSQRRLPPTATSLADQRLDRQQQQVAITESDF